VSSRSIHEPSWRAARRGGLTLVELLVAVAVLVVVALVAFPTTISCVALSHAAREQSVANHDLSSAVEDLQCTPFSSVTTTYPSGAAIPKYGALHLRDERIVVDYADPNADPLVLTVTATWSDEKGRPRQEVYRCARTR
jgi:prepilin-type N-terminal cleavage/methylation domain-containing protein